MLAPTSRGPKDNEITATLASMIRSRGFPQNFVLRLLIPLRLPALQGKLFPIVNVIQQPFTGAARRCHFSFCFHQALEQCLSLPGKSLTLPLEGLDMHPSPLQHLCLAHFLVTRIMLRVC